MSSFLFLLSFFSIIASIIVSHTDVLLLIFLSSQCVLAFLWAGRKNAVMLCLSKSMTRQSFWVYARRNVDIILLCASMCYFVILLHHWHNLGWNSHIRVYNNQIVSIPEEEQESNEGAKGYFDINKVTRFIVDKTRNYADEDSAGLLAALLVGRKQYLPAALLDISRRSGASHLLALSGFHLNLLLYFLFRLKGKLPFLLQSSLTLVIVWGYCLWIGFIPSLYRAAIMFTAAVLTKHCWGEIQFISLWSLTNIIMLFVFSDALNSVAFVLSQLALIGIVYGRVLFPKKLDRLIPPFVIQSLSVGYGAVISTAWYSFIVFGAVYPVSIISAIVLSPLIILFILCGLIFLIVPAGFVYYPATVLQMLGSIIRNTMSYSSRISSIENMEQLVLFYAFVCMSALFALYLNRNLS